MSDIRSRPVAAVLQESANQAHCAEKYPHSDHREVPRAASVNRYDEPEKRGEVRDGPQVGPGPGESRPEALP